MEKDRTITFSVDVSKGFDCKHISKYEYAIVEDKNFEDGKNFVYDVYNNGIDEGYKSGVIDADIDGFKKGFAAGIIITGAITSIFYAITKKDKIKKSIEDLKSRVKARKAKKNAKDA